MTSLLGHDAQAETILSAAAAGRMHHGWMLAGPKGLGKASFARAVATRLLAEAAGPPPEGSGLHVPFNHRIVSLMAADSHPDYAELRRAPKKDAKKGEDDDSEANLARNITVDQVRGLQRLFTTAPSLSRRRVIVIDAADDLERGAANALLKSLEEPPPDTLFLLVCHAPGRLLPTIRSRCRVLRFSPLSDTDMHTVLRGHMPEADIPEIDALVEAGEGSPGRALTFAGLGLAQIEAMLTAIAADGDPGNAQRLALGRALASKAARPRYEALLERVPAFIAQAARQRNGPALDQAITAWEGARALASGAIILSLDPATVVFELTSHVAALAGENTRNTA